MAPIIDWENMCISVETQGSCKNKDEYLNILQFPTFHTYIQLTASCSFLLALFCFSLLRQKGQLDKSLAVCLTIFLRLNYTRDSTLNAQFFCCSCCCFCCCCYISVVQTGHLFENPNVLFFVNVLYVSNFTIVKKENDSFLQR